MDPCAYELVLDVCVLECVCLCASVGRSSILLKLNPIVYRQREESIRIERTRNTLAFHIRMHADSLLAAIPENFIELKCIN